ncbi:TonB-dependent receptor plug domain-containing protein [uncultured Erythrobacter sp.]|uniref:TonB-dependent receptor plug domain-containing protein n=1 Tax=uncultured Erythrobacter sp. TaxID=263913 RepID=UPI002657C664|nr:TonB-dependent receptor plug domain-containing protein [uncultured Erythrobacter sp.]
MTFGAVLRGSVALAAAWPSIALAQNALPDEPIATEEDQAEETAPGNIVITANRTASLLSKAPIALSAASGESLIQAGINSPTQLEETVPNLSIVRNIGLQITIRSVTSTDNAEKGDPSAAFMVNGIYIARAQSQEVSFYDIERVEVLRGPQGTLYGCNSTAAVVNILTAEPKFDFGARGDIVYGSFDALNVSAMLKLPVSDKIALRIAGNLDQRDSFLIDGRPNDRMSFDRFKENKSIRVSALFEPTEDLSLLLVGDYSTIKGKSALFYDPETLTAYEGGFKFRIGQPGSVTCAYNRVQGEQACASDYLLNQLLKRDWGLKGFVMSEWGAVPNVEAALKGLDQQSGEQLDPAVFFDAKTLGRLAKTDKRYAARLDDMNRRILWAIDNNEFDKNPAQPGRKVDFAAHGAVAEEIARQGIVLLRNRDRALPLVGSAKTILVIGG